MPALVNDMSAKRLAAVIEAVRTADVRRIPLLRAPTAEMQHIMRIKRAGTIKRLVTHRTSTDGAQPAVTVRLTNCDVHVSSCAIGHSDAHTVAWRNAEVWIPLI